MPTRSVGKASGIFCAVVLLGDRGIYFRHQEHLRRSLHRVKGLYDSQVVGRKYGSETNENYQRPRTLAPSGNSDFPILDAEY